MRLLKEELRQKLERQYEQPDSGTVEKVASIFP
jgi:hypothetical protein